MRSVCVFCGSNPGNAAAYVAAASSFGALLARSGRQLVYGGGRVGLMGALADAALAAGGEVVGVIPEALAAREVAHTGLSELRIVDSMHERKALMAELADGFVALPGGLGTLEELFEVWTWGQLGIHGKPCGLLEVDGFFAPLLRFLDGLVAHGFVKHEHRAMLSVHDDPARLIEGMLAQHPPSGDKWLRPADA